jgi:hypothetical protein
VKRARILGAGLVAALLVRGTPGAAQASVAANAGLYSAYTWRGVTYTNNFVIQPDIAATIPAGRMSVTGGLWANVEPTRYDGFRDISENGGMSGFDVAEINWLGELGVPLTKQATLTAGATGYIFPNDDGLTSTSNSVELYGRVKLDIPFSPAAALYYDIGPVKGAYVEGEVSHTVSALGAVPLTFGALAGISAGQDAQLDADGEPQAESYNFEKNGFTHADLWASADLTAGALAISPTLHLIVTGDETTKISRMETDPATGMPRPNRTGAKLWFGIAIGWSR